MKSRRTLDPAKILGHAFPPQTYAYTEGEAILYALSVGAGQDPTAPEELPFLYEGFQGGFRVLPTFATTFGSGVFQGLGEVPGLPFDLTGLLHGEHALELPAPLPPRATVTTHARITGVYDKASGALILVEAESRNQEQVLLARNRYSLFLKGLGGFGGERGPSPEVHALPDRPPDAVHTDPTLPQQALLHRLLGDRNPLHVDPAVARRAGFDRTILHGLCTLGLAGRVLLHRFAGGDPGRCQGIRARFARPVFPGDTLIHEMWRMEPERVLFRTRAAGREVEVLTHGIFELRA